MEISIVPFQAIFGIRLYLSTEQGKEKKPKKPSNWEDCSANEAVNNNNLMKGVGICPASAREEWQAKDAALQFFTKGLQTCSQNKDVKNQICMYVASGKRHLCYFGGTGEKEFKTPQLRRLRSINLILRGTKMHLKGYLYFHQSFLLSTRVPQQEFMELCCTKEDTLHFLFFFFCPWSAACFPHSSPSPRHPLYCTGRENSI